MAPYFHPTQIVLVDDDIDFLGNLSLQLEADLPYLLFDSTHKALGYINDRESEAPSRQRFFRFDNGGSALSGGGGERKVSLDTDAITREMYFTNRFSQISIAMVDYAMPQMNGLEFCRQIRNPHIKKILFTGVATEVEAVEAFNKGVIDRFIRKSERNVYEQLNQTIRELQHAHILDTFSAATDVFDVRVPDLLRDPAVETLLKNLRARYDFVEYYMTDDPAGFLLVDGDGELYRLVLVDADQQQRLIEQVEASGAPQECLKLLSTGDNLLDPAMLNGAQNVTSDPYRQWKSHIRVATRLEGKRSYRWAVFEAGLPDSDVTAPNSTFNRYLEWLDTVGYSLM
ncbi:response regulator [Salinisphaera dokdonensis]|uniref:response regulator n=1 Tax=Salinisphaera dokdonensis TaxID=454598 RepID=UPI00333F1C93